MVVETPNFERGNDVGQEEAKKVSEFVIFKQESETIKEEVDVEESAKIIEQSINTEIE